MNKTGEILILIPTFPGGVASYFKTLQLEKHVNASYFVVNSQKPQGRLATIWRLFSRYLIFSYKVLKNQYKIIHINPSLVKRSFYRDSLFIIISRILNKKTLVFFRGWREDFENEIKNGKFKSFLFRISYAKVNKYIVLSDSFKKKLIALGVPSTTCFFIETTVADSSFLQDYTFEKKITTYKEKIIFLFLSRIIKEKGIYIAIDAYQKFLSDYPDRQSGLIIAGDGAELEQVKSYVQKLKIPEIYFAGHVNGDSKKKILLESHVLLLPSYSEGMPNAILEGMLYGMPIVSRTTGGIPDVVKQNINGFITESLEPQIFTDFISLLATDTELYNRMAENNHKIAAERFTKEAVLNRILNIYNTC